MLEDLKTCRVCGKNYKQSKNEGYCSSNCLNLENNLKTIDYSNKYFETKSELGAEIIELRKKGLSQKKISEILRCSKSTVSYHCSTTTKIKKQEKLIKLKEDNPAIYKLIKHLDGFKQRCKKLKSISKNKDWNKKLRTAVSFFRNQNNMNVEINYTYKEALEHLGGIHTKCYLTGTPINIETDEYCLDHILPVSKGGNNELSNMGITIPTANASKTNLEISEYLLLCEKVLANFGYTIMPPKC